MAVTRPRAHLSRVLDDLGSTLLDVVAAPPSLDPVVRDVSLYDPLDEAAFGPGELLLGVGVQRPDHVEDLIRRLGRAGAAALVVKAPVDVGPDLRQAVDDSGVTLLGLTRAARWLQVASLLRALLWEDVFDVPAGDEELAGSPAGDLFALANAVSNLLDAPVTIEDRSLRVLAYSAGQHETDEARVATILGRQVPEKYQRAMEERGVLQKVFAGAGPVYVSDLGEGMLPRVAVAVRAGDDVLGSMWAAVREPLSPQRETAFADVAKVVALHLLRQRAGADVGRRLRADLLATVLEGGPGAASAASRLGLSGRWLCVVAAQPVLGEGAALEAARQRLTETLALHLAALHPRAAAALVGGVTYAVLPLHPSETAQRDGDEQVLRLAEDFLARTGERDGVVIGVGGPAESLRDVVRSRSEAERVLRVLRSGPPAPDRRRAARLRDVQLESLLLTLSDVLSEDDGRLSGPVTTLLNYDARHQTKFVETVLTWLDTFGNVNDAAAAVHVHPNTFRYRLRRLCEISGLDLEDPDQRLAVMLQLRLRRLVGE